MDNQVLETGDVSNDLILRALRTLPIKVREFEIDLVANGIPKQLRRNEAEILKYLTLCEVEGVIPYSRMSFTRSVGGLFFPEDLTFHILCDDDNRTFYRISGAVSEAVTDKRRPHLINFKGDGESFDYFMHSKIDGLLNLGYQPQYGTTGLVKVASRYHDSNDASFMFRKGGNDQDGMSLNTNRLTGNDKDFAKSWFRELTQTTQQRASA